MDVFERARPSRDWLVGLAVAVPLVLAMLLGSQVGGDLVDITINNVSEVIAAGLAALTTALAARRSHGAARTGWFALSAGCILWAVGQSIWTYNEVVRGLDTPFPSFADVLFLSFVPLAGFALFHLTATAVRTAGRLRTLLDSLIVGLGLLALAWMLVLRSIVKASDASVLEKAVAIAYPVTDIMLTVLVISLLPRAHPGDRRAWYLLGIGLVCFALADTAFVFLDLQGLYEGRLLAIDAGWLAGFLLVAVAPLYYEGQDSLAPLYQKKYGNLLPHLVLIPVFIVMGALAYQGFTPDLGVSMLVFGLVLLAAVSQFATNRENLELMDDLEDALARARESEDSARSLAVRIEDAQRVAKVGTWEWDPGTDRVWGTLQTALLLEDQHLRFPIRLTEFLEAIDPEDRSELVAHLARATNGQGAFKMDARLRGDRGMRWVHIRGDAGSPKGGRANVTGTLHDVTERRAAEEKVLESRRLLEEAQTLAQVGNWEYDATTDRFELSDEMYRILGTDRATFRPSLEEFLALVPEDQRGKLTVSIRSLYGNRGAQELEHQFVRPDGRARWVHERAQARIGANGRVTKLFGTVHDITERKAAEEQRMRGAEQERELKRLQEINDFKTQFINMAAHELRTRAESGERKKDVDALQVVDRNVGRIERLVEDLLSAARIQSQRLRVDKRQVNVGTLIADSVKTFGPIATARGIVLSFRSEPGLLVTGDAGRLSQVLYNLFDNALKFTPVGGRVSAEATGDGTEVRLEVRDTGVGMDASQIERLFQPFTQVHDPEANPGVGGTGLGLYISRGIIEAHSGKLWCESKGPGQGTAFIASLPRRQASQKQEPVEPIAADVP